MRAAAWAWSAYWCSMPGARLRPSGWQVRRSGRCGCSRGIVGSGRAARRCGAAGWPGTRSPVRLLVAVFLATAGEVVVVGEGGEVDGAADVGVVGGLYQAQVVDAGGLHRCGGLGFDVGVGVAFDLVGYRLAHRAALVLDLDAGQVERCGAT